MVFPGQGSQSVGMQAELATIFPIVGETYNEASSELGYDLWDLVQSGPAERLGETVVTQPAMLTAGVAAWRCWLAGGGSHPAMVAGHSLGEYTALVVAQSLSFADAVRLVRKRAELMQDAVPAGEGAMAAVLGLDDDAILKVCSGASGIGVAEPVNFNSPGQVVVAGHRSALERVIELAKEHGARRAIMLPVSVPSHSSLMRPAGLALSESLAKTPINDPQILVINSVDAQAIGGADEIREHLTEQVFSPVRWVKTVQHMAGLGADWFIECGPGKVLSGLSKRIDRALPITCLDAPAAIESALAE